MRIRIALLCLFSMALAASPSFFGGAVRGAPIQQFAISGVAEIDVVQCYDTVAANSPVQVAGRIECNAGNPATLPVNSAIRAWTVVNLPVGNRLATPVTFTPSGIGQWQQAAVPCLPVDTNNVCTSGGALGVGDMTGRVDFGCHNPLSDVLAGDGIGTGSTVNNWPDESLWHPPAYDRLAAAPALGGGGIITGGDDGYIHGAVPFPTTGVNAWSFQTSDRTALTFVYLGGVAPLTITPTKINRVTYASTYVGQASLSVTATLVGDAPDQPPDDKQRCGDAPFDSITEIGYLITPDTDTRVPRWTTLQSAYDLGDSSLDRILDWQCDVVGSPTDGDADGDCDPAATDINDYLRDSDGDLVPDGIERAYASNPALADTDGDGCNDYCEIFQYTDPSDTDTDNDGQADKPDETSTNAIGAATGDDQPSTGSDALDFTDDNCPSVANADQRNTDSMYQFHGMGLGTGDATNPDEDPWGDACDPDADNDGLPGTTEAVMRIKAWTGYSVPQATVCVGPSNTPNFPTDIVMSDLLGDVDQDYVLDGMECILRSRPDVSIRGKVTASGTVLNCSLVTPPGGTLDGGCAQPGVAGHATGSDADSDGLYLPGGNGTGVHAGLEARFRTRQINVSPGVQLDDIDADGLQGDADRDSDRDLKGIVGATANLQDGVEVRSYGTSPAGTDTDQDGCPDGDEVDDATGDGTSNSGDQGAMVAKFALNPLDDAPTDGRIDDYTTAMNFDLNKDGQVSSGDQGILAAAIAAPGSCQMAGAFVEDNVDLAGLAKGLP